MSPPTPPPDQGDLPLSPDELLALGAITPERHREIELHRAHRLRAARADFAEWDRNRELDIAHTRRIYGEDSPAASDAERTLALARTSRRRAEADAARVLARSSVSPAQVPAAAGRPRRRGAGRPRAVTRSNARSGDSGDHDGESDEGDADAAHLRGFLALLIAFPWSAPLIDRAYAFSVDIEREVSR